MPRAIAQQVLETIEAEDAYSHIALDAALERSELDSRDRALATELVYGTLTWQRALDTLLGEFLQKGVGALDRPVRVALRVAVYQLVFLDRIPAHAAVNEAVNLVKYSPARRAAGLVNGVLRNLLRKPKPWTWWREEDRKKKPARYLGQRYSMPNWLANRLLQTHGIDRAEALAEAYCGRAALYLRATQKNRNSSEWADAVPVTDVSGQTIPGAYRAETLTDPLRAGLLDGAWVVQDLGSQLIGLFSQLNPYATALDACAGLGGKTLHLAELAGEGADIVALDPISSKLDLLKSSAEILGLSERIQIVSGELQGFLAEKVIVGNNSDKNSDKNTDKNSHPLKRARGFDLVLVDAPCSGLGVIRRHPETRWRRKSSDIQALTKLQADLLDAAAGWVAPGGTLLYSVCTFTQEEGPAQIQSFLQRHPEFMPATIEQQKSSIDWAPYLLKAADPVQDAPGAPHFQIALNPLDHQTDGFFAARLQRK